MSHVLKVLKKIHTRFLLKTIGVTLCYFLAGKLGLLLAFVNPSATAIWPPTGIALAAVLLFGYKMLPAIFLGAFLVNLTTQGSLSSLIGIAFGNTLEAFVGAFLVTRFANGLAVFDRPKNIFKFTLFAAFFGPFFSATIGTTSLLFTGYLPLDNYTQSWATWWLGDASGALLVTPLIVFWVTKRSLLWKTGKTIEVIMLLLTLLFVAEVIFGGFIQRPYAPPYLSIPLLIWIALRRTQAETSTAVFLLAVIATMNTLTMHGPFAIESLGLNQSLLLLELFLGIVSVMTLIVAAIVAEQKKVDEIQGRLATIVDSSEDAIYSMTLRGIVTTWNRGATKIFGYTPEEMIGHHISRIFPDNKKNELPRIISIVKQGKYMRAYETERKTKEGRLLPVSIAISPIKDGNGNTFEISKIARDISREKELEKRKDEFISMASHELNTPITGLSIYIQALSKHFQKNGETETMEYLGKMDGQILRIRHIIRDLLDISRIRLGLISFHLVPFDMTTLVNEITEVARYMSKNHKILLEGNVKKQLLVNGDRDRLAQVLTNLLSNARKYSPTGKKIIVKVKGDKHEIIISVQDFGIGIGKKHQKKVFELFYRIQEYHGKTFPGMGIGLYLSYQIIDEHKGKMWFESTKGKGTTFYFSIPLGDTNEKKK